MTNAVEEMKSLRLHVWPAYFREIAQANMNTRYESAVSFSIALAFGLCSIVFKSAFWILIILSVLSMVFAFSTLRQFLYTRKYMMTDVYMDEQSIRILDYNNKEIRRVGYAQINGIEARTLGIFAYGNSPGSTLQRDCSRQKLIFIYVGDARCFEDLRLEAFQSAITRLYMDHWEVNSRALKPTLYDDSKAAKYWGTEIFFDDNCVAFAYDDNAWNFLQTMQRRSVCEED